MSLKHSRDNLTANIFQQISALLIAIIVPLLLSVEEYAQVTVVTVLMSFLPLADFGMATVYNRNLPAIYAKNNHKVVHVWNVTLGYFRLYTSLLFGVLISVYYFQRYHQVLIAIALFSLVILNNVTSFVTISATVRSDFRWIKNIAIVQSMGKLATLPGVWVAGVKGWFVGQLIGIGVILVSHRARSELIPVMSDRKSMDWSLIRSNITQGVVLSVITTVWLQLLSSGRIYASFNYPDTAIAQYGLVGAIYQIVVSMGIASFVPQTIQIYRKIEQDQTAAVDYAFKLVVYSSPFFIMASFTLIYIAPFVMSLIFPKYNVDRALYAPLMLSLFNLAIMVTLGSLLIGLGKTKSYLCLLIVAAMVYFGFAEVLSHDAHHLEGAEAQMLTLSAYSIALVVLVYSIYGNKITNKLMAWVACLPSLLAPMIYFYFFR